MTSSDNPKKFQELLARLSASKVISPAQNDDIVSNADQNVRSLINMGIVSETVLASEISNTYKCSLLDTNQVPTRAIENTEALSSFLIEHEVLPISFVNGVCHVAMTDPTDDFVLKVLKAKMKCSLVVSVGVRSDLLGALNRLYSNASNNTFEDGQVDVSLDLDSESSLVQELHRLIQRAISLHASDIHFEPIDSRLRVRFRVHGMLRTEYFFAEHQRDQVIARLKLMSKLDVTERRHAQNGRFKFPADGRVIDLRVSTLPLLDGESLVLRLLEFSLSQKTLQSLGFSDNIAESLMQALSVQNGLILVTGPTGSGKSTTVYSLLNQLNDNEKKLISIEDPVELNIAGINQIQVDEEHGIGFAESLKTVLRQDPDVIMVGEIRDSQTAQLAAQAALTGHLVLATLHTSSAASAVTRLKNLGLPDYLISATIRAVLAQRLLRRLCEKCISNDSPNKCGYCSGSGYSGRTIIAELLPPSAFDNNNELSEPQLVNGLLNEETLVDAAKILLQEQRIDSHEAFRVLGVNL